MTSNRPYLIRAIYEWIEDNEMTPYLLVNAGMPGVRVPPTSIHEGKVVLNIAMRAVSQLELGDKSVQFLARFGGVSQSVNVPVSAIEAIYAQETGQGMMLPKEELEYSEDEDLPDADAAESHPTGQDDGKSSEPPPRRGSHLRVVK